MAWPSAPSLPRWGSRTYGYTNHQHNHAYGQKAATIMAIQSNIRRPLYNRIQDDMSKHPMQTVRISDYTEEFSEYKEFPSGGHHVNKMTPLLAYLAKPQSHGVRIDMRFTVTDVKGTKYGAVLRVGPGKYRWFPQAEWADNDSLYIQAKNQYVAGLPNVHLLRKYNKHVRFVDRPEQVNIALNSKDWGEYTKANKHQYKMPVPNPAERVVTLPPPPPAVSHYGHKAQVMAPLAEVIHHEGDTLIVKVDGNVLVCKIQTEVK